METSVVPQCRLCLSYDSFQLNVFREDLHHKQILMKLRTCLPVKIEPGDGLPCSICYKCLSELELSFELWNKSFNSEAILRHNLERGRTLPTTMITPSVSSKDCKAFDHNTYFIEAREPQESDQNRSDDVDSSASGEMKEHLILMPEKLYGEDSNRISPLCKETPKSTKKVNSKHGLIKHCDDSKKRYPDINKPRPKDTELEAVSSFQKGHKNCLRGKGTSWMENEEFPPNEDSNAKNKYRHKNLFGEDAIDMYGSLPKSQRNAKRTANLFARGDEKGPTNRARKMQFPWEKIHKKCKEVAMSPETGSSLDTCGQSKRVTPSAKDNLNNGGLHFDPNHCPKCNMTLTPSQNLLAHFQSHIQND